MVKNTQTIRRQQPTNCLSVLDHFVGVGANKKTKRWNSADKLVQKWIDLSSMFVPLSAEFYNEIYEET